MSVVVDWVGSCGKHVCIGRLVVKVFSEMVCVLVLWIAGFAVVPVFLVVLCFPLSLAYRVCP